MTPRPRSQPAGRLAVAALAAAALTACSSPRHAPLPSIPPPGDPHGTPTRLLSDPTSARITGCAGDAARHAVTVKGTVTNRYTRVRDFAVRVDVRSGGAHVTTATAVVAALRPGQVAGFTTQDTSPAVTGHLTCAVLDVTTADTATAGG